MNAALNNRGYKVTSLLIKAAILILSFFYIGYKLSASDWTDIKEALKHANIMLLLLTFVLMFVNWGLEALKWKLLIAPLENISFLISLKAVFAGVTVSIFMPNRVGEFAGRIFFLEKAGKVEATLKNVVGSFTQFFITLLMGVIAMFLAIGLSQGYFQPMTIFNEKVCVIIAIVLVFLFFALFFLNRSREIFSPKIQSYFKAVFDIGWKTFAVVFLLSLLRYCVFLFQYYLVLLAFGIDPGMYISCVIIAITFLITSVIPSFALTEIVTRGAVASSLFAFVASDPAGVIAASLVVWIINLAIPALIGSGFIRELKFFKN